MLRFVLPFLIAWIVGPMAPLSIAHAGQIGFAGTIQRASESGVREFPSTIYAFGNNAALPLLLRPGTAISLTDSNGGSVRYNLISYNGTRAAMLTLSGAPRQIYRICATSGARLSHRCTDYRVLRVQ